MVLLLISMSTCLVTENGWNIIRSPGDGHCLLHSTVSSWKAQFSNRPSIDLEQVKSQVFIESVQNRDQYIAFIPSNNKLSFMTGLKSYVINKHYNQEFGDIVPTIIANGFKVKLVILNEASNHQSIETTSNHKNCYKHFLRSVKMV